MTIGGVFSANQVFKKITHLPRQPTCAIPTPRPFSNLARIGNSFYKADMIQLLRQDGKEWGLFGALVLGCGQREYQCRRR